MCPALGWRDRQKWCPRPESNRYAPITEAADFKINAPACNPNVYAGLQRDRNRVQRSVQRPTLRNIRASKAYHSGARLGNADKPKKTTFPAHLVDLVDQLGH